ncbi:exopolyphosphatase [Desulfurispira natronophila]|uniref:NanoRNase/pAp phosphatase (C-di-AMP/oligoRNAs hydrolase) n=1 Tax=Desulfurispira natronophila TaxID=682562 RepID=A0A7W7Y3N9_9BACT|nr:exopolyphosphatase [Desulfurispira natronophila]MBB5021222.1 nanoRNase/pAp phosphatase (c-di-AMP/oligoRNAs hydrolase) [Desulfurispira natronophila]
MKKSDKKYRLVTRSDFDGLVCGVILKELDLIDDIVFVHPKDMQDQKVEITPDDITTNLPYVPGVHLAFDHHESEVLRSEGACRENHIIDPKAPSAARVVYNYFGGNERFGKSISQDMMDAVDKSDSAQFSKDEVLNPHGWVLLNFLMDARTGLGRFRDFRISNYQLMMELIDYCKNHPIENIMQLPDVQERVELFNEHQTHFKEQIKRCTTVQGTVAVIDLREEETIHPGNRFMIYALFPEALISVHVLWGLKKQNTVFAVGKSIFDRSSRVNIGKIMLEYQGGGHANAGTCQVPNESADRILTELVDRLQG